MIYKIWGIKSILKYIREVSISMTTLCKLDGVAPLITDTPLTSSTPLSSTMQNQDKTYNGIRRLYKYKILMG